ncbi:MAG: cysteine hydrolase [Bacteroidetes bacterium B1(2017)]|nr:MAG: cysteine hydrolase [Bacteroidetes bacterium B1(2017)]
MKALLIIDMQMGSFRPYTLRYDTLGVIERINLLLEHFRNKNDKVIFIQHDGSKENVFIPESEDWQLLPELTTNSGDIYVSKVANDAFYHSKLQDVLIEHAITELYITGCATDFCVDATIKAALSKEYKITVVGDAHTTANRPHLDAPTVIKHYNWLWADMTPTNYKIQVLKTDEFLKD